MSLDVDIQINPSGRATFFFPKAEKILSHGPELEATFLLEQKTGVKTDNATF